MAKQITGCEIKIYSSVRSWLMAIGEAFKLLDHESKILRGDHSGYLQLVRSGNLDLTAWMATFAHELEELDTDGELPRTPLDTMRVEFRLLYDNEVPHEGVEWNG